MTKDTAMHQTDATGSPDALLHASGQWAADLDDAARTRLAGYLEVMAEDPFLRQVASRSLDLMHLAAGQHVLDVGCGAGVLLPALAGMVGPDGRIVGIDYSAALLEEARERVATAGLADRVTLREGDATSLPFPDAHFDATHVERVLMHLADPDRALHEMRRVVRPGGWVVAAEPDYAGLRTDHPDPEAMRLIAEQASGQFRQAGVGGELHRRMAAAGLIERRVEVLAEVETDLHPMTRAALRHGAEAAIAAGTLPRDRAETALAYIEDANRRGEYFSYDHMVIAAGRVPLA